MNLYQTHNGNVLTYNKMTEIGAIADGWKRAGESARPKDSDIVDVVLRNGIRHENARTSDFNWCLDGTEGDIVAFRIVPKPNMQLEVGGIYKTRAGAIHGPLTTSIDPTYSFTDEVRTWTHAGIYCVGSVVNDPLDLVEKIAQVPADTASDWISWGKNDKPSLPDDTIVEIAAQSGKVWTGSEAQRLNQWCWSPHIVAYRVVPQAKAKPAFSLEVGGIYRARNGDIHGPLKTATRTETYHFADATRSWTATGAYFLANPGHPRDLVALIAVVPTNGANEWIAWNQPNKPSLPDDTIVEVVTRSGTVRAGQRVDQWFWVSSPGASQPHPILAYRVVPIPIATQESVPCARTLTLEERLAKLEARFS